MDYTAANTALWNAVIQFGILACAILAANIMRRKIRWFRASLMPTAVLAGFLLLILRSAGILSMDTDMLEMITYHGIALGFIAMALRVSGPKKAESNLTGPKSGALIVSTYLVQAILGIVLCMILAATLCPGLFRAAGILLPMGYGQGPGQANNIGLSYEALGFTGGRSFGLSLAAAGYLTACIVGVVMLNVFARSGKVQRIAHDELSGSVTVDTFQDKGEVPISESLDRLSMQATLVVICYLVTFLLTRGITDGIASLSEGLAGTVNSLLWGFNFIIGSLVALGMKALLKLLHNKQFMTRQYQNNYLLNRISGLAFDLMITAGIASIEISDLSGLWIPFLVLAAAGAVGTWFYLAWICKKVYRDYYYEGLMSMFGMLTGTISSGVLLLREIDPDYKTPAAGNLVLGSSFGIFFGVPVLLLVSIAPKSAAMLWLTLAACVLYLAALLAFLLLAGRRHVQAEKETK